MNLFSLLCRLIKSIFVMAIIVVVYHSLVRLVRRYFKFPIPQFLANVIDNPLRRRMQPPETTAVRHGIEPGMTVLEIGPGNGTYTVGAARTIGREGQLATLDIEPLMIRRTRCRVQSEGLTNVHPLVGSAHELPFADGVFDRAYMIAVMGEIPEPTQALAEIRRILKADGRLACSELFIDPDYPRAKTLLRWGEEVGFRLDRKVGNFFYYTLILTPPKDEVTKK